MLKYVLAAVALFAAPIALPAAAQTAETGAEARAQREFALWLQNISGLLERAGVANDVFLRFSQGGSVNEGREQLLDRLRSLRPEAQSAQIALANIQVELGTVAPFRSPDAPDELELLSETILRDTGVYLRNMDSLLALTNEVIDAFERNDQPALRRIAPRLLQSVSMLIDGQILAVRTRQQMTSADDSSYHTLGAMLAMYEGMRACALPNIANRADALSAAANAAVASGQQGRAALARKAQEFSNIASRETDLLRQMFAVEERAYNVNDRVVALLRSAAQEARAGAGPDVLNTRYVPQLSMLESEFIRLNQEQVVLLGELTEAGRDL